MFWNKIWYTDIPLKRQCSAGKHDHQAVDKKRGYPIFLDKLRFAYVEYWYIYIYVYYTIVYALYLYLYPHLAIPQKPADHRGIWKFRHLRRCRRSPVRWRSLVEFLAIQKAMCMYSPVYTYNWLVVEKNMFYDFPYCIFSNTCFRHIGNQNNNWLICFSGVETTNQRTYIHITHIHNLYLCAYVFYTYIYIYV